MGYQFGSRSEYELRTADPVLRAVVRKALELSPMDFAVLKGFRTKTEQDVAFAAGNSKLRWPDGKHNKFPSDAVDLAPWVHRRIPWDDNRYWYHLGGVVLAAAASLGVNLRWGADWNSDADFSDQTFQDLGHFGLKGDS